jgi:gas vesicle protein
MSINLKEDQEICNAATPGPWSWYAEDNTLCWLGQTGNEHENYVMGAYTCKACAEIRANCLRPDKNDARFIAEARIRWPAALDEVKRLQDLTNWQSKNALEWKTLVGEMKDEINQWKGRYEEQAKRIKELENYWPKNTRVAMRVEGTNLFLYGSFESTSEMQKRINEFRRYILELRRRISKQHNAITLLRERKKTQIKELQETIDDKDSEIWDLESDIDDLTDDLDEDSNRKIISSLNEIVSDQAAELSRLKEQEETI